MYLKKILSGNEQAPKPDESGPDQGSDPARKPESQNSHKDQDQSSGEPVGGYRLKGIARPIDDFKDKASNSPGEIEPHQEKENRVGQLIENEKYSQGPRNRTTGQPVQVIKPQQIA